MPDTDPNQVRLTGENSFIRLQLEENGPQMTRVSHWRILYSWWAWTRPLHPERRDGQCGAHLC